MARKRQSDPVMTAGEMAVYAAVFAKRFDGSDNEAAFAAAESAAYAVEYPRDAVVGLERGFGQKSNVYRFAKAMTRG